MGVGFGLLSDGREVPRRNSDEEVKRRGIGVSNKGVEEFRGYRV